MCVLELLKSILIPFIRPRALFTFLRISFFYLPEHVPFDEKICMTAFSTKMT